MVSRTLSARDMTASSALTPFGLPVGTGGQNSMIQLDGSGMAPSGPSQGNSGVSGKYGSRSIRASDPAFPIIG